MVHHPIGGLDYTARMGEPVVDGCRKNEVSKAELFDATQALNKLGVEERNLPRMKRYRAPDGIIDMLVLSGPARRGVIDQRGKPSIGKLIDLFKQARRSFF
jgi:hypothetical protein